MKEQILTFLLVFCSLFVWSQSEMAHLQEVESKMKDWGHIIIKDTLVENRKQASADLTKQLVSTLQEPGSFQYPFDSIQTISIQYPADSSFRIFTWQLYVDINQYDYFGFIQTNEPQPKSIQLKDRSADMNDMDLDHEVLDTDNWYGAVYYKIMSFDTPEGKKHLLFGFDGYQFFNKRKIIDVLTVENGQASFGAPVFAPLDPNRVDLIKNRVLMQYSAETSISLNYNNELDMIVFDYLIPHGGPAGPTYVPDGSYHGYKLNNGLWAYVEKVFDHVWETAPVPAPVLNKRKNKDIFGN